jgi:hypothetical protein
MGHTTRRRICGLGGHTPASPLSTIKEHEPELIADPGLSRTHPGIERLHVRGSVLPSRTAKRIRTARDKPVERHDQRASEAHSLFPGGPAGRHQSRTMTFPVG